MFRWLRFLNPWRHRRLERAYWAYRAPLCEFMDMTQKGETVDMDVNMVAEQLYRIILDATDKRCGRK